MSEELKLAMVAALSAIAGSVVGGLVSYYTSRDLQSREFERSDRARAVQAKAAASVELARVITARVLVADMREHRIYPAVGRRLDEALTVGERQLVMGHMRSDQIRAYERARDCIEDFRAAVPPDGEGEVASVHVLVTLRVRDRCLAGGERALTPLSERRLE